MTPDANALDVERLREIAGKATQVRWKVGIDIDGLRGVYGTAPTELGVGEVGVCIAVTATIGRRDSARINGKAHARWDEDAAHIAAFDPPTALALLSRLDALEAENANLRVVAEKACVFIDELNSGAANCNPLWRAVREYQSALAALAPFDSKESQ